MYWFKSVLLLVVMVVYVIAMTSADFRCYDCYYGDPGCDPFDKSKVNITVCRQHQFAFACFKYIHEGRGNETITAVYTTAIITCMC